MISSNEFNELLRKAEQGDIDAQCNLGLCYENGDGVEQSYEQAVKWYTKAAEQGHAGAQCMLGECYETGDGVKQSYEEAVKWYTKVAEQGGEAAKLAQNALKRIL